MKTSSAIVLAMVAAAAGAFGYRWLMPKDAPAATQQMAKQEGKEGKEDKAGNEHAEKDEHGADRIVISDVKLAAAGATFAEAGQATLTETLAFNGVLRANQETVVQVTPRFPGLARAIKKRIGDVIAKDDLLASIESNQSLTVYDLKAPIGGTVIDRQISLGEYVSEQKPAFVVADLSTIWVDLSIYRQDLRRVRIGDEVLIDPDDGVGDIKGAISYLAPVGASETQTAIARVVLPNPNGRLRPGLFVSARLVLAERKVPVAVHAGAIQTFENKTVVFVREGADKLEARPVELGDSDQKFVEIRAGISPGEKYVAENSFVVKAEMGKGEAEHD
ncbi:efflux RND transporter periplasmic adaptor subunit [Bradyrhizobium diazoefficiens]|nr:efflux RND transporter periplasmic adaptor subunit [Bradyrhizobium diazoefficiens]MBR0965634.1 efflux RND transporter periplasmic adaptor subunit [Bradyrhizobium diazoefficiens]MBR0979326.1 efflux RND transporter periplasmic adaptor subunit [Bradyrhizobium diazoefficiens]MBR1008718.1 efflux RND transporter periplasmic adaptor subunit [Bradyrhizobium diazoefficiens]MBR1014733.1 efflux RND transporter periplasmic adaptor subunit [Bradyrhizobium diazoefficiens]MBR1052679.1 efflux RND transport